MYACAISLNSATSPQCVMAAPCAGSGPSGSHIGSPPAAAGSKASAAKAGSKARDAVPSYMMGTGHLRGEATTRVKLHFRGGNAGSSDQSSPLPGAPRRLVRSTSGMKCTVSFLQGELWINALLVCIADLG